MNKSKRDRLKRNRKDFEWRCATLRLEAATIGFELHWSKTRGEPRLTSTRFSLWQRGETKNPLIINLLINEVKENIDRLAGIKAFS